MIIALMLYSVLFTSALAVGASVLHTQERMAMRPVRWIWGVMIALSVTLTAVAPFRGSNVVATRVEPSVDPISSAATEPGVVQQLMMDAGSVLRSAFTGVASIPDIVNEVALSAWLVIGAICLCCLAAVHVSLSRTSRRWHRTNVFGTDVRISQRAGPAVIGIYPMQIVLPSWVLQQPDNQQRLVLEHENEHRRSRDPWLLMGGCVAVALMPWNPVLWYALSRLRLAVEIDCDRRVLHRQSTTVSEYGELLLELSAFRSSLPSSLPVLAYNTSHLERRILAMSQRPARFLLARRLSGAVVAGIAIVAACESQLPSVPEVPQSAAFDAVGTLIETPDTLDGRMKVSGVLDSIADSVIYLSEVEGSPLREKQRLENADVDQVLAQVKGTLKRYEAVKANYDEGMVKYNATTDSVQAFIGRLQPLLKSGVLLEKQPSADVIREVVPPPPPAPYAPPARN